MIMNSVTKCHKKVHQEFQTSQVLLTLARFPSTQNDQLDTHKNFTYRKIPSLKIKMHIHTSHSIKRIDKSSDIAEKQEHKKLFCT